MLLIEDSFSVENLFFYLKLLGKSLKEQKIMILPSGYQYSLQMMSSDSGFRMHTFIWKGGRMIDKHRCSTQLQPMSTPLLKSHPACPLVLGEANWGILDWQPWKPQVFLHAQNQAELMQQQNLPRCCSAKPEPNPAASRLAEQVLLCPHDLPAEGWNWYQSWDDISRGQRMRIPATVNQQTEHLPRSLKRHFILNSSYPASRHLIH